MIDENIITLLENGEESILLKICTDKATTEETEKWLINQQNPEEILNIITISFNAGFKMAEKMDKILSEQDKLNNICHEDNTDVILKLDHEK